ncbi:MAG: hypothetical protein Q9169_004569 [Polycauliona sp. 2 TL-2023]
MDPRAAFEKAVRLVVDTTDTLPQIPIPAASRGYLAHMCQKYPNIIAEKEGPTRYAGEALCHALKQDVPEPWTPPPRLITDYTTWIYLALCLVTLLLTWGSGATVYRVVRYNFNAEKPDVLVAKQVEYIVVIAQ